MLSKFLILEADVEVSGNVFIWELLIGSVACCSCALGLQLLLDNTIDRFFGYF